MVELKLLGNLWFVESGSTTMGQQWVIGIPPFLCSLYLPESNNKPNSMLALRDAGIWNEEGKAPPRYSNHDSASLKDLKTHFPFSHVLLMSAREFIQQRQASPLPQQSTFQESRRGCGCSQDRKMRFQFQIPPNSVLGTGTTEPARVRIPPILIHSFCQKTTQALLYQHPPKRNLLQNQLKWKWEKNVAEEQ